MANAVASMIFTMRNADKAVKTNNPLRGGVALANGTKVAGSVSHASAVQTASKWAGKIVNPLLIASCAYNVYKSDDKVKTGVSSAAGLTGMFLCEGQMKKGKIGNWVKQGANWLMKKCTKNVKAQNIGTSILTGLAFVAASIGGYELASKAGESAVDLIRKSDPKKVDENYYASYEPDVKTTLDEKA